ncbi:putative non-LTR retroelement reverse transcriptase related protein, partial [Trifolium medium]|nr:putative non-LTR retroelement reverse transcriptase related protein [Trifolium medium]
MVTDNWFEKFLFRRLGNEEDSLFWDDPWLGEGIVLSEPFPRLSGLSSEPEISMGALYRRGWGVGGAGWSWRCQLWLWRTANSKFFSVKEAYLSLTSRVDKGTTEEGHADFIWIKSVPLK